MKLGSYRLNKGSEQVMDIIRSSISGKSDLSDVKLHGKPSDEGGYDLKINRSLIMFNPNLGPLVFLNLYTSEFGAGSCDLRLRRRNGRTYKVHFWFSIVFLILTIVVSVLYIKDKGMYNGSEVLGLPLLTIGYVIGMEIIAAVKLGVVKRKLLKLFSDHGIEYQKSIS